MWQAYVGIVSRRGLEIVCSEQPETVRFLQRRVERTQGQALCFWSVAEHQAVAEVQAALASGDRKTALKLLDAAAREAGTILPRSECSDQTWVLRGER